MTQGPALRSLSGEALSDLLAKQQHGICATVKQSGHPHLTTMLHSWDPDARIVRLSTTADCVQGLSDGSAERPWSAPKLWRYG